MKFISEGVTAHVTQHFTLLYVEHLNFPDMNDTPWWNDTYGSELCRNVAPHEQGMCDRPSGHKGRHSCSSAGTVRRVWEWEEAVQSVR